MIDRKMFMPAQSFFAVAFILSVMSVPARTELAAAAGDASAPVASVVAPLTIPADVVTAAAQDAAAPPPRAFEYSDAYRTRAKIHKYSSFATLPLFVTEGSSASRSTTIPTSGKKTAHLAVAPESARCSASTPSQACGTSIEARQGSRIIPGAGGCTAC